NRISAAMTGRRRQRSPARSAGGGSDDDVTTRPLGSRSETAVDPLCAGSRFTGRSLLSAAFNPGLVRFVIRRRPRGRTSDPSRAAGIVVVTVERARRSTTEHGWGEHAHPSAGGRWEAGRWHAWAFARAPTYARPACSGSGARCWSPR